MLEGWIERVVKLPGAKNLRSGLMLMATGGFLFACMGAMAKQAGENLPTFELVAGRSAVTWLFVEIARRRVRAPLQFHDKGAVLSRSIGGFLAIAAYFHALRLIPLGDAVLLNNASPVLTSLGAVVILHERMTAAKVVALLLSIGGVLLLVGPRTGTMQSEGAIVGALSAVAAAWALVSLKVATRRNRAILVVWALAGTSTLGSLLMFDRTWQVPSPREALLLVGTGATASAAQVLTTMGYRRLEASVAAIYSYLTPFFAVVLDALLFAHRPELATVLGGGLIVVAGVVMSQHERWFRKGPPPAT